MGFIGGRWQLWPACIVLAAAALVAAALCLNAVRTWFTRHRRTRIALVVMGVFGLALTPIAYWAFPVFELPRPSGEFAIGTTQFHFIDESRPEMHTANPLDRRELMVRAWYPATAVSGQTPLPYWPDAARMQPAIDEASWPFGTLLSHLGRVPTHAFVDAPFARRNDGYPVLVFSHGLGMGYAGQNTVLIEELVSRGYVVFGIDHSYDGLAAVFPDGRVASFIADAYEAGDPEPPAEMVAEAERLLNSGDAPALLDLMQRLIRLQPRDAALSRYWNDVWSKDQRFVIDQIEQLQSGARASAFKGQLQVERLGVFGMSFGGSVTAVTCAADPRCKAGINMDGFRAVAIEASPQRAPFLYFNNGRLAPNIVFMDRDLGPRYFAQIKGTEHWDFADFPLFSPLAQLTGLSGSVPTSRMLSLVNTYVTAFFDQHLKNQPSTLLNGPSSDYPEVHFISRAPDHLDGNT